MIYQGICMKTHIANLPAHQMYLSVLRGIESYLEGKHFQKLELPTLVPALIPESYLEIFETEYRYLNNSPQKRYLIPSPELMIKRLLVEGIGDCYSLGHSYRNGEPKSSKHEGEFMMLELYKMGEDYMEMAGLVLELLQDLVPNKREEITYQGVTINLSRWEKLTVAETFKRYADISPSELFDHALFLKKAKQKGYELNKKEDGHSTLFTYEEIWSQIYANEVEKYLGMKGYPTLLYDYPVEFAPLAKPNSDGVTAQRFEFYIAGIELGNCYGELADWKLQRERLQKEQQERALSGKIAHEIDEGFVEALKQGLPTCSGIAIGVERLAMIYADVDSICKLHVISL